MSRSEFADAVLNFCGRFNASVTSWQRSLAHNLAVGGVVGSAHLYGLAADVVYDVPPALVVATPGAARLGLKLIREGNHDHLQPLDWRAG